MLTDLIRAAALTIIYAWLIVAAMLGVALVAFAIAATVDRWWPLRPGELRTFLRAFLRGRP